MKPVDHYLLHSLTNLKVGPNYYNHAILTTLMYTLQSPNDATEVDTN